MELVRIARIAALPLALAGVPAAQTSRRQAMQ